MSKTRDKNAKTSQSKTLWACFSKLNEDRNLLEIFLSFKQPVKSGQTLLVLLSKTEDFLNQSFKISHEKFIEKTNKNDKNDLIDARNITFDAFRRRVANLVLEEIYLKEKPQKTLAQFISETWFALKPKDKLKISPVKNKKIDKEDESPPFAFSNMSIDDDLFKSKRNSVEDELDLSEIRVDDGYRQSSSIAKAEINQVFEELKKEEETNGLPIIQVTKYEDSHNKGKSMRKGEKKFTGLSQKLSNQGTYLVINEADESEKSESYHAAGSPTFSFTGVGSALRPSSPMMASITGFGSHIKAASDDDSSDEDNQRTSIFSMFNAKIIPRTFEKSKPLKNLQKSEKSKKILTSSSEESEKNSENFENIDTFFQEPEEINPWFTLKIAKNESKFKKIFKKFSGKSEIIKLANLDELFISTLKKLKIFPYDHYRLTFKVLYQSLYPGKYLKISKRIIEPRLNFFEFAEIMNLWGDKFQKERKTLLGRLIKTADIFRTLQETIENDLLSDAVSFILFRLMKMISEQGLSRKSEEIEENYKKHLEEIFLFYAKLQKIQGSEPTFESVENNNLSWTLGKFLKFCNDFHLVLGKNEGFRATSKENLMSIFKKTAVNTRIMNLQQFLESLDKISEFLYSPEFDRKLITNHAFKSLSEKRILLFDSLEILNFQRIKQKIKPFGPSFSPDKKTRIPKFDPSNNYKFKINPRKKRELEEFQRIPKVFNLSPAYNKAKVLSPQPTLKSVHRIFHSDGYSNKFRMLPKLAGFKSGLNFSEHPELVKRKSPEALTERLTIKSLHHMNYQDIDDEYSLKDLIMNDSDEEVDKLYSLSPRMDKLINIHGNQRPRRY